MQSEKLEYLIFRDAIFVVTHPIFDLPIFFLCFPYGDRNAALQVNGVSARGRSVYEKRCKNEES